MDAQWVLRGSPVMVTNLNAHIDHRHDRQEMPQHPVTGRPEFFLSPGVVLWVFGGSPGPGVLADDLNPQDVIRDDDDLTPDGGDSDGSPTADGSGSTSRGVDPGDDGLTDLTGDLLGLLCTAGRHDPPGLAAKVVDFNGGGHDDLLPDRHDGGRYGTAVRAVLCPD